MMKYMEAGTETGRYGSEDLTRRRCATCNTVDLIDKQVTPWVFCNILLELPQGDWNGPG